METRLKIRPIRIARSLQTTKPEHHPTNSNPSSTTRTILRDLRMKICNLQDRLNRLKIRIGTRETVGNHSHQTATVLPRGSLLKMMIRHTVAVAESIQAVEQSSAVPQPTALLKKTKKEQADQARHSRIHRALADGYEQREIRGLRRHGAIQENLNGKVEIS